jgi:hypothetical protein
VRPKPRKPIEVTREVAENLESILADAIEGKIGDGLWSKRDTTELLQCLEDLLVPKKDKDALVRYVAEVVDAKCIAAQEGSRMFFEDAVDAYKSLDVYLNRNFAVTGRRRFAFEVEA